MHQIKVYKEEMVDCFFELTEAIEEFEAEPLVRNKKRAQEKMKKFNNVKVKLSHRINDFWCKGEKDGNKRI